MGKYVSTKSSESHLTELSEEVHTYHIGHEKRINP